MLRIFDHLKNLVISGEDKVKNAYYQFVMYSYIANISYFKT